MYKKYHKAIELSIKQVKSANHLVNGSIEDLFSALALEDREAIEFAREEVICSYQDYIDSCIENYLLVNCKGYYNGQT